MDRRGIDPSPLPVGYRIRVLQVLEHEVHARDDVAVGVWRGVAGRLKGQVDGRGWFVAIGRNKLRPSRMEDVGEFYEEGGLHQGFAAGEGDSAARRREYVGIREKLAGEFGHGPAASAHYLRPMGTGPFEGELVVWRDVPAVPAACAELLLEEDFRLWGQALGVVAPSAAKGAALEEHGGAHAWSVVQAEFPHFEDDCCFRTVHARSIAQSAVLW